MKRAVPSAFAGNAGEFFVLAELTRRGWTAALTARNNRAYDILAKQGDHFAAIRVKTKTSAFELFQWNAKASGEIFVEMTRGHDFCVLVDIPKDEYVGPTYYIVPTHRIDKWLKDDFQTWVKTPGAKGQQRAKDNKRRLFYVDDDTSRLAHGYRQKLAEFKGAWNLLLKS
jgi:Holliday junction resolvase-like predicted endonuclease